MTCGNTESFCQTVGLGASVECTVFVGLTVL